MSHYHREITVKTYVVQFPTLDAMFEFIREYDGQNLEMTVDLSDYIVTFQNSKTFGRWSDV